MNAVSQQYKPSIMTDPIPSAPETDPDVLLMLEVKAGSNDALRMLMERWKNPLLNFFQRSVHNLADAEDLAQATFIRIARAAPTYEPKAHFSTFLFHVARHLLINEHRRRMRKPAEPFDPSEMPQTAVSEVADRECQELDEAFERALGTLPENHRTAILLWKQQALSYREIATIMDASESAVKTWIFRAREALRQQLKDYLP